MSHLQVSDSRSGKKNSNSLSNPQLIASTEFGGSNVVRRSLSANDVLQQEGNAMAMPRRAVPKMHHKHRQPPQGHSVVLRTRWNRNYCTSSAHSARLVCPVSFRATFGNEG